ncbi:uncharacterized protein LY89DRAFT_394094 [Mollisia scopiformis]|uniref:Uncharacterized protein n=1 Tax=Mollisia scopiformis TaxID=149040 RepID=A0A194XPW7_MOLSC|nr:uncharacterized protein LY89DRAFT_394094 [Mollisia scopiformis]KUJ22099.1 hypothetical protein LY89DRAFT_394094 [Mollisia scopiformis]
MSRLCTNPSLFLILLSGTTSLRRIIISAILIIRSLLAMFLGIRCDVDESGTMCDFCAFCAVRAVCTLCARSIVFNFFAHVDLFVSFLLDFQISS